MLLTLLQDGDGWLPSRPGRCTKCEGASQAERFGETENLWIERRPASSQVALPTEQSQIMTASSDVSSRA
jgi:hypothetical protein